MESQQPSSSSAAAASSPDILLLEELSQCLQMFRQLMDRKEEGDKLKCLTRFLEIWHQISQSDELKMCQEQNQQKDADKQIEEGQQQKLQIRKQMGQKGIEMIRMIEDLIDGLAVSKELMWQTMAQMTRKKPAGRKLPNELCAEMVKAMPLSAKLTQVENLVGTVIGQYIQKGLNKLSITPNNVWDGDHCINLALSDDQLTVRQNSATGRGRQNVRAKLPIPKRANGIFYYEVYLHGMNVCIELRQCRFTAGGSFWAGLEYFDHIFGKGRGFRAGDWVGCGVHLATRQLFFTLNGNFLGIAAVFPAFVEHIDLFPRLAFLPGGNTAVETNFGRRPFQWRCTDAELATMAKGAGPTHLREADKARMAEALADWN